MKINGKQKNLYMLALMLLIAAVALACVWTFMGDEIASSDQLAAPQPTGATPTAMPASDAEMTAAQAVTPAPEDTIKTVVYYQDNYGYLVPVQCNVAMQDGIAKATLSMMVKSSENDMAAARLGLRTVLPEGTTIDLDIADGTARIDLGKQVLEMEDAAAEYGMICAIVQTLTEFDTVKRVEFLIGGQKMEKLTHGTDISKAFERGDINLESGVSDTENSNPVMLYFPCESTSVVVPVTRMVKSDADINTAVLELAKGPAENCPLERALPDGCGLIDVRVENGIARVNFTKEFAQMIENADGGRMALKALVLTCTQFEGIDGVEIYVEGEKYDPGKGALSVPSFANIADDIVYESIQTQSGMIFEE